MEIKLGNLVRDKVTGFTGIAVSKTEWMTGCIRFAVQSQKLKDDGGVLDPQWFDDTQLEIVNDGLVEKKTNEPPSGGPKIIPQRRKDPVK